jgi:hypothetical protein
MKRIAIVGLALLVAVPAFAGAPATGTYYSWDLPGGSFDAGRFSESWLPSSGQIGNTVNAMSWDGATLGGEWKVWCPSIASSPTLVADTRNASGDGDVIYFTIYGGGSFWFSGAGPWGDSSQDYTGWLNTFNVTSTHQYIGWVRTGVRSNITMTGQFDGFDNCMEYVISNAAFVGETTYGPLPGDYPPFLDSNCNSGPTAGGWGDAVQIELNISGSCTVPIEDKTWGAVKALYAQ